MDPVAQTLLTVFGASALTAAAGLIGARVQSQREHARWLREKRYDAYLGLMRLIDDVNEFVASQSSEPAYVAEPRKALRKLRGDDSGLEEAEAKLNHAMHLRDRTTDSATAVFILGPATVAEAARAVLDADATSLGSARLHLRDVMQDALNINRPPGTKKRPANRG